MLICFTLVLTAGWVAVAMTLEGRKESLSWESIWILLKAGLLPLQPYPSKVLWSRLNLEPVDSHEKMGWQENLSLWPSFWKWVLLILLMNSILRLINYQLFTTSVTIRRSWVIELAGGLFLYALIVEVLSQIPYCVWSCPCIFELTFKFGHLDILCLIVPHQKQKLRSLLYLNSIHKGWFRSSSRLPLNWGLVISTHTQIRRKGPHATLSLSASILIISPILLPKISPNTLFIIPKWILCNWTHIGSLINWIFLGVKPAS